MWAIRGYHATWVSVCVSVGEGGPGTCPVRDGCVSPCISERERFLFFSHALCILLCPSALLLGCVLWALM